MSDQDRTKLEQATAQLTARFMRPATWLEWCVELGTIPAKETNPNLPDDFNDQSAS